MKLVRFLRRLRLELDQALRVRTFVSRAVRGQLQPEELLDLTSQLAFLLYHVGGERSARMLGLAGEDARELRQASARPLPPPPCLAVLFFGDLARSAYVDSEAQLYDVLTAVAGTSWVGTTASAYQQRTGLPATFLAELNRQSSRSLSNLSRQASTSTDALDPLVTFAELGRGALLGLSNYLDQAWPGPTHAGRFDLQRPPLSMSHGERLP